MKDARISLNKKLHTAQNIDYHAACRSGTAPFIKRNAIIRSSAI